MKRIIVIALAVVCIFNLIACGSSDSNLSNDESNESSEEISAAVESSEAESTAEAESEEDTSDSDSSQTPQESSTDPMEDSNLSNDESNESSEESSATVESSEAESTAEEESEEDTSDSDSSQTPQESSTDPMEDSSSDTSTVESVVLSGYLPVLEELNDDSYILEGVYTLFDVNGDGIDELFTYEKRDVRSVWEDFTRYCAVYTLSDGKAVKLYDACISGGMSGYGQHVSVVSYEGKRYLCIDVMNVGEFNRYYDFFTLNGASLDEEMNADCNGGTMEYLINGENVTEEELKEFESNLISLFDINTANFISYEEMKDFLS